VLKNKIRGDNISPLSPDISGDEEKKILRPGRERAGERVSISKTMRGIIGIGDSGDG
jgi:hypothetical protein